MGPRCKEKGRERTGNEVYFFLFLVRVPPYKVFNIRLCRVFLKQKSVLPMLVKPVTST